MRFLIVFCFSLLATINGFSQRVSSSFFDGQIYMKLSDNYQFKSNPNSDQVSIEELPFIKDLAVQFGIEKVRSSFYFSKDDGLRRTLRIYFNQANDIADLLEKLNRMPQVQYAEPVPLHRKSLTPNDLGANNTGNSGQWGLYRINAQAAWDISIGNSNVVVAVVDDAVQTTHPDLNDVCLPGRDVSSNNNNPNPPSTAFDHGTHVAGIIGAETNNGTGIASIGWGISILPVKATNEVEFITDGYEGCVWAIENGADVINMSWGGDGGGTTGQNIMNLGFNSGVVLVAASGNDDVSTVFFPAGFNNVISVASTSSSDAKSSFSNYGSWIDISAPGSSIRSTVPNNAYSLKSGTSMASPLVAGLCGLMLSANPLLTPNEVLDCLQASAVNINNANPNFIGQLGAGRINAQAALECANANALVFDAGVSQILFPSASTCETSFQPSVTIRNTGQTTLTSLLINMTLDGTNAGSFTWTGSLPSQQSANVTLPTINAGIGSHVLQICSSTMNTNQPDIYSLNNCQTLNFQVISPEGANLPFIETFESNSLSTNGWTLINSDNAETWEIVTTQGASPGTRSARIPFFTYASTGQRDALITPSFNFAIYTDIEISFEHAYRRYQAGVSDSLIVSLSTDCGATFPHRIFVGGENGTGSFATQSISTTAFVPASPDDWCSGPIGSECVTIDLTPFAGNSGVRIKFEGYNNYGNNLYLDNINISGSLSGAPATADFSVNGSQVLCQGSSVQFTNLSGNAATAYSWSFPGGQPAVSQAINPTILYNQPGVYEVSLTSSNQFGQDTEVKTGFIQVVAAPSLGVSINPPATCQGNPVAISASGAQNYAWSPAVAISNSAGPGITANPPQTTVYTLTGTNAQGCSSAIDFTVQVYPNPPQPQISLQSQDLLVASNGTGYQWYLNGNPINGAVFQEFSPQQSGNYTVEVFNSNGCSSNSETFNYDSNILSQDLILNTAPFIYPNPAEGLIQIAHVSGSFAYSIFAADGKLVMSGQSDKNVIDLNGVAPGIYQIILSQNNQLVPLRFVLKPGFNY